MILSFLFVLVLQDQATGDAAAAADAAMGKGQAEESLFESDPENGSVRSVRYRQDRPNCDRDGNTLQLNACIADDLALETARMERYFDLAMEQATAKDADLDVHLEPTQQVELLTTAQAAWSAYAELRCEAVWDQVKGGTIRTIVVTGCWIDATRQRTHDIWTDHLTYWDSTPPMLPEPVLTVFEEQQAVAQQP